MSTTSINEYLSENNSSTSHSFKIKLMLALLAFFISIIGIAISAFGFSALMGLIPLAALSVAVALVPVVAAITIGLGCAIFALPLIAALTSVNFKLINVYLPKDSIDESIAEDENYIKVKGFPFLHTTAKLLCLALAFSAIIAAAAVGVGLGAILFPAFGVAIIGSLAALLGMPVLTTAVIGTAVATGITVAPVIGTLFAPVVGVVAKEIHKKLNPNRYYEAIDSHFNNGCDSF